jgi:parallel beta-helix repeat protein
MIKLAKIKNNRNIKKVFNMIFLFSFIFIGLNPVSPGNMQQTENVGENLLISPLGAEVHSTILIVGNAELAAFCAGNGTDGSSWAAAHVIKDYEIDAEASGCAIEIRDTTLFVIIQNCTVTNSEDDNDAGIFLDNCTNVKITGCNSSFNPVYGIHLYDSHDCIISENNVSDNVFGIYLFESSNNTISGNNASHHTEDGIYLNNNCDNNTISENNATDNGIGIHLGTTSRNNTISGNNASYNTYCGISFYDFSDSNTISGNTACNNTVYGIYLTECDNNTISRNVVNGNEFVGIHLNHQCTNNTMLGNTLNENDDSGIFLEGDNDNNTILGNTLNDNGHSGIYLEADNDNNTILGNLASFNEYGIYLLGSNNEDNTIWMNYFGDNSISQGWSDSTSNSNWDNGQLGNYWGDFGERYPDATSSNGIWWDSEYQVNTSSYNDTRPLVDPGLPEISSSGNVDYLISDEGNEISWTISDLTILDPTYWIYLEGDEIQTGSWSSGSSIPINVDGFSIGTYNYVLKCNDGTPWGLSESQIVVSVAEIPKPVIITASQTITTKNITVEWSEVVGVDSYNVYVNGTLTNNTDTLEQNIWLNESGTYLITVTAINGAEESEHSEAIVIVVDIPASSGGNNNAGIIIGSIGGSVAVVGVIAVLFIKKRRTPK